MSGTQGYEERPANSWHEAKERLLSIASERGKVLFRGQANSKWPLVSSLARIVKRLLVREKRSTDKTIRFARDLEYKLVEEFKRAYERIPGLPSLSDESQNELVAFAQHYSLPTRLLDWSSSPYIAAFFAFDGSGNTVFGPKETVAIWALRWQRMELLVYHKYTKTIPEECISEYPSDFSDLMQTIRKDNFPRVEVVEIFGNPNRRLVYQQGLFTCAMATEDDLKMYIQRNRRFAPGIVLTKIVIPGRVQEEALEDLSWMGINPVSLMNDADSAAAAAFNKVIRFNAAVPREQ